MVVTLGFSLSHINLAFISSEELQRSVLETNLKTYLFLFCFETFFRTTRSQVLPGEEGVELGRHGEVLAGAVGVERHTAQTLVFTFINNIYMINLHSQ